MSQSTIENIESTIKEWDIEFNKLQMNKAFFFFEIILALYVLLNLALIAEKFLMPSLMNLSQRYGMSKDLTGILVAIGNLVPELTTTILSFMKHGVKMTEFGVACNIGTSVFVITVVPAVAILLSMTKEDNTKYSNFED
jgi:Ca2+/Na+ antiporter